MKEFLTKDAIPYHNKHRSRTYLFLSGDGMNVQAFVTLGIKCMKVPETNVLSAKIRKDMDIYKGVSQTYLLGQLCKSKTVEEKIGSDLIDFALRIFNQSFKSLGCRAIRADCKSDLIGFYEKNGFRLVSQDGDTGLYHMVMLL